MPRGSSRPSEVFKTVLREAEQQLLSSSRETAKAFAHKGLKGDERAEALAQFLRGHLPAAFGVGKGEAIDFRDQRTGQLDLIIYDKNGSAPITAIRENTLLPCEAPYAVIEVKTTLSQDGLNTTFAAAKRIRTLRPFKQAFVGPRKRGANASDRKSRCLYLLFAYDTNLSEKDWLAKEFERIEQAALAAGAPLDVVERIAVLSRGMINTTNVTGKATEETEGISLGFYLNLVNFLNRERSRRNPVDWQVYSARTAVGWKKLR